MQLRTRAPDNELFDRGCDLVEAATAIRRLARDEDGQRAIPALLGCIETSLQELAEAAAELEASGAPATRRDERMRRGFANLRTALADAAVAAHAARSLAARALARHIRD